ncbi:hypothetical protein GE09DRAFT_1221621 [Coniochaeta sp. 2T2.1]|nr:hypothetical protein GE09DRAFT_1221621 [Coniochaeta sp. 2T2.1]
MKLLLNLILLFLTAAAPSALAQSPQESSPTASATTSAFFALESTTTTTTSETTCTPCKLDHDANTAVRWCTECRLGPGPMHCSIPFSVPCDAAVDGSSDDGLFGGS